MLARGVANAAHAVSYSTHRFIRLRSITYEDFRREPPNRQRLYCGGMAVRRTAQGGSSTIRNHQWFQVVVVGETATEPNEPEGAT
jgi:hypothetical protein